MCECFRDEYGQFEHCEACEYRDAVSGWDLQRDSDGCSSCGRTMYLNAARVYVGGEPVCFECSGYTREETKGTDWEALEDFHVFS